MSDPPESCRAAPAADDERPTTTPADGQVHRLCVFDLWLTCGHIATVTVDGWYPVSVACCERLGGTVLRGEYVPFAAEVAYVTVVSERYEHRPDGTAREPTHVVGRRPRTDDPRPGAYLGTEPSSGRYPARVGAVWSLDGSVAATAGS